MRKPITHAYFHPSVKDWSFDRFKQRYQGQFTEDEIKHFAISLGLVSEPAADEKSAPVTPITVSIDNVITEEEIKGFQDDLKAGAKSINRQIKKRAKSKDKTKAEGPE